MTIKDIFSAIVNQPDLRKKVLFIVGLLVVYRLAANIPLPGVNALQLKELFDGNQLLSMLNVFSGGGLSNISIVLLGVGPYITASIIMQLMTTIIPSLERLYKEEGEAGRQKFNFWTRWLTVPLAVIQAYAMISLLKSQNVFTDLTPFTTVVIVITATAGSIFLMWLGELITEKGLGNGVSMMIFAGIVAALPTGVSRFMATWDPSQFFSYLLFFMVGAITIAGVILVNEGQRIIPVSYAKRVRGSQVYGGTASHLPLKVNQAGVIPIIFAVSIILIPTMIASFVAQAYQGQKAGEMAIQVSAFLQDQFVYGLLFFILVILFTYFYTTVVFDPYKISENLQKQGGYVPGIRPGQATADHLHYIIMRITLAGSVFLGLIAVLPYIVQGITHIQALQIGGVSILIVVSVVLEFIKHTESQLAMRSYEGF
jgi:preprotein translocase subunit SecY